MKMLLAGKTGHSSILLNLLRIVFGAVPRAIAPALDVPQCVQGIAAHCDNLRADLDADDVREETWVLLGDAGNRRLWLKVAVHQDVIIAHVCCSLIVLPLELDMVESLQECLANAGFQVRVVTNAVQPDWELIVPKLPGEDYALRHPRRRREVIVDGELA